MHNYAISDICFWCLLLRYHVIHSFMHESTTKKAICFSLKLLNQFKSKIDGINQLHLSFQATAFHFLAYGVSIDFRGALCTKYLEKWEFIESPHISIPNVDSSVVLPMYISMIVRSLFPC